MSSAFWEAEYGGHGLWDEIEVAKNLLDSGPQPATDVEKSYVDRLRFVFGYVREQHDALGPTVPMTSLNEAETAVSHARVNLTEWHNTGDDAFLQIAATTDVEDLLLALRGWPPTKDRYTKGVTAAASEFVEAAHRQLESVESKVESLKSELADAVAALGSYRAAADAAALETSAQVASVRDATNAQTLRLDEALNGHQQTFALAEATRATEHQAALATQLKAEEDARSAAEAAMAADRSRWDQLANAELEAIEDLKQKAENLVNAVGLVVTATEYRSYADAERRQANVWRWIAAGAFVIAFGVFVTLLVTDYGGEIDGNSSWQLLVFKVGGSVALVGLGGYAARESSSHRRSERAARNIQLDLAALEPFIANMTDEQKLQIRLGAARRLFVTTPSPSELRGNAPDTIPAD